MTSHCNDVLIKPSLPKERYNEAITFPSPQLHHHQSCWSYGRSRRLPPEGHNGHLTVLKRRKRKEKMRKRWRLQRGDTGAGSWPHQAQEWQQILGAHLEAWYLRRDWPETGCKKGESLVAAFRPCQQSCD